MPLPAARRHAAPRRLGDLLRRARAQQLLIDVALEDQVRIVRRAAARSCRTPRLITSAPDAAIRSRYGHSLTNRMRGTPRTPAKIAWWYGCAQRSVLLAVQHPGPGIEQLIDVRPVARSACAGNATVAVARRSSRAFQTRGCSAAKRRVAAMSLPVPMQYVATVNGAPAKTSTGSSPRSSSRTQPQQIADVLKALADRAARPAVRTSASVRIGWSGTGPCGRLAA